MQVVHSWINTIFFIGTSLLSHSYVLRQNMNCDVAYASCKGKLLETTWKDFPGEDRQCILFQKTCTCWSVCDPTSVETVFSWARIFLFSLEVSACLERNPQQRWTRKALESCCSRQSSWQLRQKGSQSSHTWSATCRRSSRPGSGCAPAPWPAPPRRLRMWRRKYRALTLETLHVQCKLFMGLLSSVWGVLLGEIEWLQSCFIDHCKACVSFYFLFIFLLLPKSNRIVEGFICGATVHRFGH